MSHPQLPAESDEKQKDFYLQLRDKVGEWFEKMQIKSRNRQSILPLATFQLQRQRQTKHGALPFLTFDADISPETSGQNEGACQAEAVTFTRDDGTFLHLGITFEYQFLMLRFDPGSVIGNQQQ